MTDKRKRWEHAQDKRTRPHRGDRLVIDDPWPVSPPVVDYVFNCRGEPVAREGSLADRFTALPLDRDNPTHWDAADVVNEKLRGMAVGGFVKQGPNGEVPAVLSPGCCAGFTHGHRPSLIGMDLASRPDASVQVLYRQSGGQIAEVLQYANEQVAKAMYVPPHLLGGGYSMSAHHAPRWGDSGADPLAALKAWQERMLDALATLTRPEPLRIIMSARNWFIVERRRAGKQPTKRAFRRWHGKRKAAQRVARLERQQMRLQGRTGSIIIDDRWP